MPEPTGSRRIRPKRLARQLLDEELRATTARTRQREPAARPVRDPAPRPAEREPTSQAADAAADELLRLLREIWLRLLRYRRGQAAGAGGEDGHPEQSSPAPSQDPYRAGPTEPWQPPYQQGRPQAPGHPDPRQHFPAPGFAQAPHVARRPGFARPGPGFAASSPDWGSAPPPQQPDGRRRLMKEQPRSARSSFEQYGNLLPEQQAAVRKEVSKLIDGRTRYQVAASRHLLPFNVALAQAARPTATSTGTPRSGRSWLSGLTPRRRAKRRDSTLRPATAAAAAPVARMAAPPVARMAAPPRLPQLPHYAGQTPVEAGTAPQRTPGPRPGDPVTRAPSRTVAPVRGSSAGHTQGPPVPPKVPIVPPKIPLKAPGTEPGRPPRAADTARQPSPPSSPVSSPASPAMPPVSPVSRPVSPAGMPVSPVAPPASPGFSPAVAHQSLEHHRSGSEARGRDVTRSPQTPDRAPAAQQAGMVRRAPSRSR
ncbi:hypothetical protein AB0939_06635 [Streptomyces sp. NPDC006990]|uniref:hypothetical protein n=1 Tax=Streptomyces sp. NPDC006990 TaxID=3154481 RepID=UPI003454FF43